MLSKRFKNDGRPILDLNELQKNTKKQVEKKIADGIYSFEEVPCCVCAGKNFELLSRKDRYGLYLPVVICRDCGLVQANPRWTEQTYRQFYEIEYRRLYMGRDVPTDEFFKSQYQRGAQIYDYLASNVTSELVHLFVVEVGCSAGGILQYFSEKGNEVYGVDLDPSYIEFGRVNHGLNIEVGTIDKVMKLDKSPGVVIYSHVLEHILDPPAELMKLRNVLAPNSIIYIELPGIKNLIRSYQRDFLRLLQNAHVYYPTLTTLSNILGRAGYDLVGGDEVIHSVFRKGSLRESAQVRYDSDYQSTMAFLSRLESTRLLPTPHKVEAYFVTLTLKVLKTVGLYDFARSLYRRVCQ